MRLIDADALKDWSEIVPLTDDGGIDINDFDEKLTSMPTVDAVPVIRCKDCKKFVTEEDQAYCLDMYGQCDENGFCAWAERKEE